MSYKFNSSNCSLIDESTECSVLAKLRRLKIEENLLIRNINKNNVKEGGEDCIYLPIIYSSNLKNDMETLKNTFLEIKNMFGDIKAVTEGNTNSIDIENMKRDVLKLDEKLRNFKSHLQYELTSSTAKEEEMLKQLNNFEEKQTECAFKSKIKIKPFSHIVPSPVKALIQSPLKCKEAQRFQEFMMSSPNRYGGWNEYHHNVFVNTWYKYFNTRHNVSQDFCIGDYDQFQAFQNDVMQKISAYSNFTGSSIDDIITHCKWYCKYLYFKEQQQNALNNWKRNKRVMSKSHYTRSIDDNDKRSGENLKLSRKSKNNVKELLDTMESNSAEDIANAMCDMNVSMTLQDDGSSIALETHTSTGKSGDVPDAIKQRRRSFSEVHKPTRQWINRCNTSRENVNGFHDLDTIKKLRIPEWRQILQE